MAICLRLHWNTAHMTHQTFLAISPTELYKMDSALDGTNLVVFEIVQLFG